MIASLILWAIVDGSAVAASVLDPVQLDAFWAREIDFIHLEKDAVFFRSGTHGRVYRYESAGGEAVAIKVYSDPYRAREDQRTLEFLRRHAEPSDDVRVVPSILHQERVMLHLFIHGERLGDLLGPEGLPRGRRAEILRRYRRYLKTVFKRQRAFFGPDVEIGRRHSASETPSKQCVSWLTSTLKEPRWADYGLQRFIPHPKNIIVEEPTNRLWLIDPN